MIQLLFSLCCFMCLSFQSSCIDFTPMNFSAYVSVWVRFLHLKVVHCWLSEPHGPFGVGWKSDAFCVYAVCVEKRMISQVWKYVMVCYLQDVQRLSPLKYLPPQPCLQPLLSQSPPLQCPNRKQPDPLCNPPGLGCLRSTPPGGPIDPSPQHVQTRMHLTSARGTLTQWPYWEGRCLCSRLITLICSKCSYIV